MTIKKLKDLMKDYDDDVVVVNKNFIMEVNNDVIWMSLWL